MPGRDTQRQKQMKPFQNIPAGTSNSLERAARTAGDKAMEILAEKYRRQSGKAAWDPNAPETEEDGIRAESLRRLKVRQMFKSRDRSPK